MAEVASYTLNQPSYLAYIKTLRHLEITFLLPLEAKKHECELPVVLHWMQLVVVTYCKLTFILKSFCLKKTHKKTKGSNCAHACHLLAQRCSEGFSPRTLRWHNVTQCHFSHNQLFNSGNAFFQRWPREEFILNCSQSWFLSPAMNL